VRAARALFSFLAFPLHVFAHPVAQGSLELHSRAGAIEARFRISNEEVFVASTFASPGTPPTSLEEMWREHGRYLLAHIQVDADGVPLRGEVLKVIAPADQTTKGFVVYALRFPLATTGAYARRVGVREDLLNEIEFAPGNPWEATFVTRILLDDTVIAEGLLLTAQQPIDHTLADDLAGSFDHAPILSPGKLASDYLEHGVRHILGGWDHLLFMTALVLAVAGLWDLIAVVTAFSLAHTVTLTFAALHWINLPRGLVEPMIALSIVVVAVQNLFAPRQTRGWPRLAVAFGFGLFHGLGFAGGLLDAMTNLPSTAIATAIAAFSVGVELGHQVVVLPLFGGMILARRQSEHAAGRLRKVGSASVLFAGVYYLVLALR
jgi:hydrogenase/urease accessory protein HupE